MQDNNNRNTIIFVVSAVIILIVYQIFVLEPASKRRNAELGRQKAAAAQVADVADVAAKPGALPSAAPGTVVVSRQEAAAASARAPIDSPALSGSISLRGARIDDLFLKDYRVSIEKTSPPVELLRPEGARHAFFAEFGWTGANLPGLPNADTVWQVAQGSTLP